MTDRWLYVAFGERLHAGEPRDYRSYGMLVYELGQRPRRLLTMHDLSPEGAAVAGLAALCTRLQLEPCHLPDVLDDWLCCRHEETAPYGQPAGR